MKKADIQGKILQGNSIFTLKTLQNMKPKIIDQRTDDLFRSRLSSQINLSHELVRLAETIDWEGLHTHLSQLFTAGSGQPPKPVRLIVGLLILQQTYGCSDEEVVQRWIENPYWQYFCGYDFLQTDFPAHPTSLTRWRERLGKEQMEKILAYTIQLGVGTKTIEASSLKDVTVDTTVMPKNVTYPTDVKLLHRGIEKIVALAKRNQISLRQSYKRVAKRALVQAGRYAHARQMKRFRKEERRLRTWLSRLHREMRRKAKALYEPLEPLIDKLLNQRRSDKDKLYSLHEPSVSCIAKGKAHKKYEFGSKVSLTVTNREGFALSLQAYVGNPHDSKTLATAFKETERMTGVKVENGYVDRGYRGHGIEGTSVMVTGSRRLSRTLKKRLKRRQAIEPVIGHMKSEGKLGRCYLKGQVGDEYQVVLSGIGHNIRQILRRLKAFLSKLFSCRPHGLIGQLT